MIFFRSLITLIYSMFSACIFYFFVTSPCNAHAIVGLVSPSIPIPVTLNANIENNVKSILYLLNGRITAVQLIFTSCSSICPLQGATFSEVERLIEKKNHPNFRLLSLSIDAKNDNISELTQWLRKFGAGSRWSAGSISEGSLLPIYKILDDAPPTLYQHSAKIYIFDTTGSLVWRSAPFPLPKDIVNVMENIDNIKKI